MIERINQTRNLYNEVYYFYVNNKISVNEFDLALSLKIQVYEIKI